MFRNYMNDSFRTSVFVQYSPETIACACIFLAARVLKIPLPNNPEWFTIFNAKEEDLQDICISLLSVYQLKISSYETADSKVLECREAIQLEKQRARGILGGTDKVANSANNSPVSNSSTPRGSSIVLEKDHSNLAKKAVMGSSKNHAQKERRNAHYDNYNSAKRSRTRSTSNKHNMSSGSSEYSSDSDDGKSRKKARKNDKDILPKSYSQHNNSDNYREKRRHRHHKRHKSHRSDSHHRSRKSRRSSREKPQGYRSESSNKKHKRKLEKNGIPDLSLRASISQNGESKSSPPSKSHKKHSRAYRDERKKRSKRERSPDQHIRSTSATKP